MDLGTGNGHFLIRLRNDNDDEEEDDDDDDEGDDDDNGEGKWGFKGRMLGVDYSPQSIALALRLAASQPSTSTIQFLTWDIITSPPSTILTAAQSTGWDVVHDKGTFDAISLSDETDTNGKRIVEGYKSRLLPLIREGGLFIITSCNWTEEELRVWFCGKAEEGLRLEWVRGLKYRSFRFGGREGQTVCSACFRKVERMGA